MSGTDYVCDGCGNNRAYCVCDETPAGPAVDDSLSPLDLTAVVAGNYAQPNPTILRRDDGQSLLYSAEVNGIHGPSGEGKTWVALAAMVEQMGAGHTVMLVDLEDNPTSVVAKLRLLGATDSDILQRLAYIRPTVELSDRVAVEFLAVLVCEQRRPSLVVIDSLGEAFSLDGINEDRDNEVGPWLRRVARRFAECGPAVLLVDHSTKTNDNPLHPSGSKRKRAAITGASYLVTATTPLVAGQGGRLRLTAAKDRHGTYRRAEAVANVVLTPTATGGLTVRLYAPDDAATARNDAAAKRLAEAITAAVEVVRETGKPMSLRAITGAMNGSNETKRAALDHAVLRSLLVETEGPRRSRIFGLPEHTDDHAERAAAASRSGALCAPECLNRRVGRVRVPTIHSGRCERSERRERWG